MSNKNSKVNKISRIYNYSDFEINKPKTDNRQPNSGNYISNKGIENIVEEAAKSDEGIKMLIDESAKNHNAGLIFSLLNKFGEDYRKASDDKKYCMFTHLGRVKIEEEIRTQAEPRYDERFYVLELSLNGNNDTHSKMLVSDLIHLIDDDKATKKRRIDKRLNKGDLFECKEYKGRVYHLDKKNHKMGIVVDTIDYRSRR